MTTFTLPNNDAELNQHPLLPEFDAFIQRVGSTLWRYDFSDPGNFELAALYIAGYNQACAQAAVEQAAVRPALEACLAVFDQAITLGRCAQFADVTGGPMGNVITLREQVTKALAAIYQPEPPATK